MDDRRRVLRIPQQLARLASRLEPRLRGGLADANEQFGVDLVGLRLEVLVAHARSSWIVTAELSPTAVTPFSPVRVASIWRTFMAAA